MSICVLANGSSWVNIWVLYAWQAAEASVRRSASARYQTHAPHLNVARATTAGCWHGSQFLELLEAVVLLTRFDIRQACPAPGKPYVFRRFSNHADARVGVVVPRNQQHPLVAAHANRQRDGHAGK